MAFYGGILALLGTAPLICGLRRMRHRRLAKRRFKAELCPNCGYPYRGLPELRCPECGQTLPDLDEYWEP